MLKKKHAMDDDITPNVTIEGNVDYLSYNFDEMDLAASWRVLTKQKLNIINGIRLENASWRTWGKQRNNLKTVSPETLNWYLLKDSDVTWLYGPLHTVIKGGKDPFLKKEIRPSPSPIQQSQPQKPLKSALKKVTMSDLLKRSASELQIHNNNNKNDEEVQNDSNLSSSLSISKVNQQVGAFSPSVIANHRQPKLRFNQYVEQCVALGNNKKKNKYDEEDDNITTDYEPEEEEEEEEYESEAEDGIIMRPRPQKIRSSIRKIEPTLLKTSSRSEQEYSDDSDDDYPPNFIKRKSSTNWDAESAQSDALVQHIIEVSKNKPTNNNHVQWNTDDDDDQGVPSKSDYDYEFDDDDWDTHSEHVIDDTPYHWDDGNHSTNGSILNNLVRWASNHLWSSSDNDENK
ncbi:hypothetical protein RO3G_14811 [Rhizopus delemar RA 99-880]|uniref:Nitrogen regulatory protein areA GATA-like domain-containing protein n=1 Tax=Rhizopus delemar (strain RA 99-880 / ATCC MYA-4621 / FGSC 9543 / NRRL 43880) TaxID=246409 RepID=I1CNS0_RHIO9|nr:hypothetical protein RO3G_14811 [Rhizopus delemar RA 99-880]|eukprot:EIE90100.1 hypothetical protein RO3G_14811 [Rhizopus delemar RA 99-880]